MGVHVPCRVHAEVPQEAAVWANQAAPRHCLSRACQAQGMQDRRRTSDARPCAYPDIDPAEVFGGGGDRVLEREKLDLDCAECGTQAAQFFLATNSGRGAISFRPSGGTRRRSAPTSKIRRSRTSSWISCNRSSRPHKVPSLVPESFITAFGGSPSNPQLRWGLLAL